MWGQPNIRNPTFKTGTCNSCLCNVTAAAETSRPSGSTPYSGCNGLTRNSIWHCEGTFGHVTGTIVSVPAATEGCLTFHFYLDGLGGVGYHLLCLTVSKSLSSFRGLSCTRIMILLISRTPGVCHFLWHISYESFGSFTTRTPLRVLNFPSTVMPNPR